jgi:hypothetical protein
LERGIFLTEDVCVSALLVIRWMCLWFGCSTNLAAPQDFEHCLCLLKFITNLRMGTPSEGVGLPFRATLFLANFQTPICCKNSTVRQVFACWCFLWDLLGNQRVVEFGRIQTPQNLAAPQDQHA